MDELEFYYNQIKNSNVDGNVILPKEFLRKFIMMNFLILKENNININFEKKKKYIDILGILLKLFN